MVLIYGPDYFVSNDITNVDFADDSVTLNKSHGKVVNQFDIEFYWCFGVRRAFKHGDPQQDFLLGQMKSPLFEEYLAGLIDSRNGQGFGKEPWVNGARIEKTLNLDTAVGAGPLATEREKPQAPCAVRIIDA